jgi:oligopeptide/dipeptide ABC transporter ATP-binding protein
MGSDAVVGDTVPTLAVEGLTVELRIGASWHAAVTDLSFHVGRGETVGLAGESGCGKSTTGHAIMGLLPERTARIAAGRIAVDGTDLLQLSSEERRRYRGNRMAVIFQEPMASLNPAFTVGEQIAETLRVHRGMSRKQAWERAIALLERVEIAQARQRVSNYPYQFSGGMLQRVMIAAAIACDPEVLIADEPTTALDVTTQDQVLRLLKELQLQNQMSMVFITHDLAVMSDICDRLTVMYAGRAIEQAAVDDVLDEPRHPYTRGLIDADPRNAGDRTRLTVIPGRVPNLDSYPQGCGFHPRCAWAIDVCATQEPSMVTTEDGHGDRCLRSEEIRSGLVAS